MNTTVKQFEGKNGAVKNQFIIYDGKKTIFQSYDSIIAVEEQGKPTKLDKKYYNYSNTTSKYMFQFLCVENRKEVEAGIKSGKYILTNLN